MQDDIRASLDDLAIRWETPKGRELKKAVIQDARYNDGQGIADILKDFMYVGEVPHGRDLRCVTLENEDLSDTKFGRVDMSWASLAGSTLTRSNLVKANLKRANLKGATLSLARLDSADCSRADFSEGSLDGTHFKEAKLTGAIFIDADVSRASFDSANMSKSNFHHAKLDQANFFNADCNNSNFDSGAMENMAARPAKAWGLRYDMEQGEFEKQVGLKAMTSRATKKFKGLEMLLKAQAQAEKLTAGMNSPPEPEAPKQDDGGMFFGTGFPRKDEPEEQPVAEANVADRPPPRSPPTGRRRPPPPPPSRGGRPTGRGPSTGPQRRPPPGRQTGRTPRPPAPTGRGRRRPPGPGGPGPGPDPRRTTGRRRPPPEAAPAPPMPIAPFDDGGPAPASDWAKAIGQLMQLKNGVTKIVVELGDKSRIIYKKT